MGTVGLILIRYVFYSDDSEPFPSYTVLRNAVTRACNRGEGEDNVKVVADIEVPSPVFHQMITQPSKNWSGVIRDRGGYEGPRIAERRKVTQVANAESTEEVIFVDREGYDSLTYIGMRCLI